MNFLANYGLFLLKTITTMIAILILISASASRSHKSKLELIDLNKKYAALQSLIYKQTKRKKDKQKKYDKKQENNKPYLYLLKFDGDIKASQVEQLREEITAILSIAKPNDEVAIQLESPGGSVNGYGLAAAQLHRLRDANIRTTICIDKIAASGGYLMACCANHIIAAPFAIIGSVGVVAQLPNFHKWLKKQGIDFELLTSGEYKRTLTIFGENTEKGRAKFQEDLDKIHLAFRNYVFINRDILTIDEIATGEHWLATDAYHLKLVDELMTSDTFIQNKLTTFKVFQVRLPAHKSFISKLSNIGTKYMMPTQYI